MPNDKDKLLTEQIFETLFSRIMKFEYDNMKLPSQNELCKEFNVSRITIRKVFEKLFDMGLIETHRRRGTFIKEIEEFDKNIRKNAVKKNNKKLSTTIVLSIKEESLHKEAIKYLCIKKGEDIVNIERVRIINDIKISYENTYINKNIFKDFRWSQKIKDGVSLHGTLRKYFNLSFGRIEESILAVNPPKNIRRLLNIDSKNPVLFVKKTVYSPKYKYPFEYSEIYILAEFFGKIIYNN